METGIALYNTELHGCLNGVYTNDGAKGEISNEVAKLKHGTSLGIDGISGEYDCFYFDTKNRREGWVLIITAHASNPSKGIYWFDFLWKDKNRKDEFRGVGYKMNSSQIAVHYEYIGKK